jgi:hypothetical protein
VNEETLVAVPKRVTIRRSDLLELPATPWDYAASARAAASLAPGGLHAEIARIRKARRSALERLIAARTEGK